MQATAKTYRYQLQTYKGGQTRLDCPGCGQKKTFAPYIDNRTGEQLEGYGRCNRESNCGYHLSPYHKGPSGLSFADEVYQREKQEYARQLSGSRVGLKPSSQIRTKKALLTTATKPASVSSTLSVEKPIYSIPDTLFQLSVGHYEHNQFARLLQGHLGAEVASRLLYQFKVGTSNRWPGACVFWMIDEYGRVRGGQIKQFGDDWHTVKYVDLTGRKRAKVDWVHSALKRHLERKGKPLPDWLEVYIDKAERSPCLFGLPQLSTVQHRATMPAVQPVAIVEAPKTAILCTAYFPQFVWLATGSLSNLTAGRLAPLKGRIIVLFPDLNAYHDFVNEKGHVTKGWLTRANELNQQGFTISVSDYLERLATDEERTQGLDLADYLLAHWKNYPPDWD